MQYSLNGNWLLYQVVNDVHIVNDQKGIKRPEELAAAGLAAIPAHVPGNVELDLQRNGLLEDPFYGANIRLLRPFESHDWWYQRSFHLPENFLTQANQPGNRIDLVFEGLDTLATIWLNGTCLGQADNMLIPHRYSVTGLLLNGEENHLVVRLASALEVARHFEYEPGELSWEHRFEGLNLRKAPHVWGWDILPRAVSAGIWRGVHLEVITPDAIEWIYYWTSAIDQHGATLGARFQVRTQETSLDGLSIQFHGVCEDHTFEYTWPLEFIADGCQIPVPGARLWFPVGYGKPNLYQLTARLCRGETVLAERTEQIGLRKLRLERTEKAGQAWTPEPSALEPARIDVSPSAESHFVFYVNDRPIMVKGSNWVPLDAFHGRDAERLVKVLALVEEMGCNMLRCWGGGVYESNAFFDWCDTHGVLVWQDFAFACCIYPQTEAFLTRVRAEAEQVVRILRNHASLACWCGDNEIDMVYLSEGRDPGGNRLTRQVLPQVIQRLDPHREFIPSSPYVPPSLAGRPDAWQSTPEQHLWGPRGYFKSPFYTRHSAHFIGEIGYHGCPSPGSIRKFISPEALWPPDQNDEWQVHAVYHWRHQAIDRDRIHLMQNQVREFFGSLPTDLETFSLASQIVQAEAKKFFLESTRLRKWATSGILWWNLIDGWPQFSDAVVDYFFDKKLAFYYLQRVHTPVCLVVGEPGSGKHLPVVACNDSLQAADLAWRIWDVETDQTVSEGAFEVPPEQNWQIARLRTFASEQRLYLIEWTLNGQVFSNHYLVGTPPFNLERYQSWLPKILAQPGSDV